MKTYAVGEWLYKQAMYILCMAKCVKPNSVSVVFLENKHVQAYKKMNNMAKYTEQISYGL